jgi:hypothetical protein
MLPTAGSDYAISHLSTNATSRKQEVTQDNDTEYFTLHNQKEKVGKNLLFSKSIHNHHT